MSNENKHPKAELSDAELAGVSGGDEFDCVMAVHELCLKCAKEGNCGHRAELFYYIRDHGIGSVPSASYCPFNDKA